MENQVPAKKPFAFRPDKKTVAVFIVIFILAFVLGSRYGVYTEAQRHPQPELIIPVGDNATPDPTSQTEPEEEAEPKLLAVHVKGAVETPGLYWLEEGSRLADALEMASVLPEADLDRVNLASVLEDGKAIRLPFFDEEPTEEEIAALNEESGSSGSSSVASVSWPINVNTATKSQLMALPGIGEVKAQAIIDYRERNGGFSSIEQLINVSGIGNATMNNIRDKVRVD